MQHADARGALVLLLPQAAALPALRLHLPRLAGAEGQAEGTVSADLVRRWRRMARQWRHTAETAREIQEVERSACRARATVLNECAASLELSMKLRARRQLKERK